VNKPKYNYYVEYDELESVFSLYIVFYLRLSSYALSSEGCKLDAISASCETMLVPWFMVGVESILILLLLLLSWLLNLLSLYFLFFCYLVIWRLDYVLDGSGTYEILDMSLPMWVLDGLWVGVFETTGNCGIEYLV
jgi:hypothetical protein